MDVSRLYDFMREREEIRLRKEAGQPFPWTDDRILSQYKFTNVKREHDKTTRLLVQEFYQPNYNADPEALLLNCAIARYFGTIEFMRAAGWQNYFAPNYLKRLAKERKEAKLRVFTGAYVITNQGICAPKEDVVVDIFLQGLWDYRHHVLKYIARGSWEAAMGALMALQGFGGTGFMAKEVLLDTMFTSLWPELPTDFNTWCPAGPGARRGINLLLGRPLKAAMNGKRALAIMLDIYKDWNVYWPQTWQPLVLHDIQFQLCEFAKYEKVRLGMGRPRSLYKPPTEE